MTKAHALRRATCARRSGVCKDLGVVGRSGISIVAVAIFAALLSAVPALADHQQPAPDITKMDYTPVGKFGPAGTNNVVAGETPSASLPTPRPTPLPPTSGAYPGAVYNPSGKWVAYDNNVFTALNYPDRHPDSVGTEADPTKDIPAGGQSAYGRCPERPGFITGDCGNHAREYREYFEAQMKAILGEFGVVIKRYPFHSPGAGLPRGQFIAASDGSAVNIGAVVPGADHPEQTVLVSGHYDFTDSGPDAAWDSSEGHQEVIRMAAIMADYWRKTGTRPSATIKFIPWDSEESGTFGSLDYTENNIPPGEESKVRAYFNVDPCASAYPALNRGNPALERIPEIMQLADPAADSLAPEDAERITRFNERAETIIDEVFANLGNDATNNARLNSTASGGPREIFVGTAEAQAKGIRSDRGMIQTAVGGLALFSSDYRNFEALGIPIFNIFPDVFGPKADGSTRPGDSDGVAILHTQRDNLTTINALTSIDQSGFTASEGWAEGMEMCAQLESWYMLQPEMGGAQTVAPDRNDVLAYYEALPNEAIVNQNVTFDAGGSYEYLNVGTRQTTDDLEYLWDFGDGQTGTGKVVEHSYNEIRKYPTKLTVRSRSDPARSDTMEIPVTVIGSDFTGPTLRPPAPEDPDGTFPLAWDFTGSSQGFDRFSVEESRDFTVLASDDAEGDPAERYTLAKEGNAAIQNWQRSDSSTQKVRGNQRRSGARSYWAGIPANQIAPAGTVQEGSATLTFKEPFVVPAANPELSYFSLFQNEGDDQGRVEVAQVAPDGTVGEWEAVDVIQATSTAAGGPFDRAICNPSEPQTFTTGFENRRADLLPFRGKQILVRISLRYGPENRALSQPCGWYVDDLRISAGTFAPIGSTPTKTFEVAGRPNGTFAYRILAVYQSGIQTAPSNTEVVRVTNSSVPPGPGPGGTDPGPGPGPGPGGTGPGGTGPGGTGPGPGPVRPADPGPASRRFLISRRAIRLRRGVARVAVSCRQVTACRGTLRLRASVRSGRRVRMVVIGRRSFSVAARRRTFLRVRVSRTGRRLVARERRGVRTLVIANVRPPAGVAANSRRDTATASFRLVRGRRR